MGTQAEQVGGELPEGPRAPGRVERMQTDWAFHHPRAPFLLPRTTGSHAKRLASSLPTLCVRLPGAHFSVSLPAWFI